jgi:hypothetical protein
MRPKNELFEMVMFYYMNRIFNIIIDFIFIRITFFSGLREVK